MKLLFVDFTLPYLLRDSEFPVGGWAVQLKEWLLELSAQGHRVGVLTWKGANAHVGPQSVCELVETYDPQAGIKVLRYAYLRIPALLAAARAWRPDAIVQSTASLDTGIMAFIAGRLDVPFVHRIACDSDVDERLKLELKLYQRIAYRYGLRRADLVVCQNAHQAALFGRAHPGTPLHVQPSVLRLPPGMPRPRDERNYVAWLGVFKPQKNLRLLYSTAKRRPAVEFRVAGMAPAKVDGDTMRDLECLRTLSNVRFVGYKRRAEVADFLGRATVLLCTSHYEGFSNTFLEAFAAGTPVVTRKGVDPDSAVSNCGLGLVAEDDGQLADCVSELHEMSPARFGELAQRCRQHLETRHAPAPVLRTFVDALRPLMAARRR